MNSIFSKFAVFAFAGIIALMLGILAINYAVIQYVIIPNEVSKAHTVTKAVVNDISAPLQLTLDGDIKETMHGIVKSNNDILYVLLNYNGSIFSTGTPKNNECCGFLIQDTIYDQLGKSKIGDFSLCYSRASVDDIIEQQIKISIAIFVIIVIIALAMLKVLHVFLKPLVELSSQLEKFNPIFPHKLDKTVSNNKEIVIIQNAIIRAIDELLKYQTKLEYDVQLRTQELNLQKEMFKSLVNNSLNPVLFVDRTIKFANPAFFKLTGYTQNETGKAAIKDILMRKDNRKLYKLFFQNRKKQHFAFIYNDAILTRNNFAKLPISISIASIMKENTPFYIINITDLSEIKQKEAMLLTQSRFAAMGEMIANIAHQWRQPLNALAASIQDVPIALWRGNMTQEYANALKKEGMELINYMSHTIDDFRNFFKPDKSKIEFNIKQSIEKANTLVRDALKSAFIEVQIDVPNEDINIYGYPNEFSQVLLNILNNAKDALKNCDISKERIIKIVASQDERNIRVLIMDNAGGIAPDIIDKIFDPYFTTKHQAQGTGLGLYMSKMIIEQNMGGALSVSNRQDGACFEILLHRNGTL